MDLFSAVFGASVALSVRAYVTWKERVNEKRRTCNHKFDHMSYYAGCKKRHCSLCGYQEFVEEKKD